jgi:hypothetical protein
MDESAVSRAQLEQQNRQGTTAVKPLGFQFFQLLIRHLCRMWYYVSMGERVDRDNTNLDLWRREQNSQALDKLIRRYQRGVFSFIQLTFLKNKI